MPPGTFHAVFTVDIPFLGPKSTVMTGSHFLSRHTMAASLFAAISHVFWHDLWTNATHDDRDYTIARMLAWQAYASPSNAPFEGKNLYALLVFGKLPHLLRSLPWKKSHALASSWLRRFDPLAALPDGGLDQFPAHRLLQDVRAYMGRLCDRIVLGLKPQQREDYREFWEDARAFYTMEFEAREQYNRDSSTER
jgi:hypothetical protein